MKSERRHELQKNELADWLGEQIEAIKPHATMITIVGVVALAAILGGIWYFGGQDQAAARTWSAFFGAYNEREPEQAMADILREQPGSTAALWAAQSVGDMNVARGAGLMFSDRAEAQKHFDKAKTALEQVVAASPDSMLKARAELSLGKLYEAMLKPDEARKHYEAAAELAKSDAIGKLAAESAQRMKDERQVALLAWFAEQTPKRPAPIPGLGGGSPALPSDLPARPDISLPQGLGLDNIGAADPASPRPEFPPVETTVPPASPTESDAPAAVPPTEPSAETPAAPSAAPTDAPAADAPKPADEATPAPESKSQSEEKAADSE